MRTTTFALAILSLWRACSAQTETLVPITAADIGLQRRDGNTVTLQNQVQLLWGGTNKSYFANMTLQSGDNELVLSTEYFGTVLSNLTCTSKLSLTFNSNTTFQAAIADWQWVNFSENRTFIMIVNYPGCTQNTDNGRQPWIVSNVRDYDEINLTVDFEATLSTWAIVAHDFILDFGSSTPTPSAIAARDNSYYVDPNSMSRVSPRWNKDESISLNLQHELPSTLYSQTLYGLDFSILCPGCETTGEIKLDGHLEYTLFGPKVISLTATPKDVGINLTALGFQVSGTLGSGWGDSVFVVPDVGLPGWSIPGIFDFGPQFSVEVGFQLSGVKGSATIEAGFTANIPDSSTAVLGIKGVDSSSSGWVPNVVTQPPSLNIEVDGSLELYARTSLDLGATILSVYSFGAGIFMKLPDVILTLGAEYDSAGVCDTSDVFAVNFGATVGVDLELGVYTQAGGAKDWAYNHSIYTNNDLITPISKCIPLGDSKPASASLVSFSSIGTPPGSSSTPALSTTVSSSTATGIPLPSANSSTILTSRPTATGTGVLSAYGSGTSYASGTGAVPGSSVLLTTIPTATASGNLTLARGRFARHMRQ